MRRERAKENDKKKKNRVTPELFVGIFKNSGLENEIAFEQKMIVIPVKSSFQYT